MSGAAPVFRRWLPLGFATTVLACAGWLAWSQQLRRAADEPQHALVMDAVGAIAAGGAARDYLPPPRALEAGEGLFLAGYTADGAPAWSSARMHGALPAPPRAVFRHADGGEHRLTWMPAPGIREALVIVALPRRAGYLLAGRSLHETEARKAQVASLCLAGWAMAMLGSLALAIWFDPRR